MTAAIPTILCVLATSICLILPSLPAASQTKRNATSEENLQSLLTERRDTLRQIVNLVESYYKQGNETLGNVIKARNDLLDAELNIANTHAERIRIRKEQVKNYRELEDGLTARHTSGEITSFEILVAKAMRLDAEIQLLRE